MSEEKTKRSANLDSISVCRDEIKKLRQQLVALKYQHSKEINRIQSALNELRCANCAGEATTIATKPKHSPSSANSSPSRPACSTNYSPIGTIVTSFQNKRGVPRQPSVAADMAGTVVIDTAVFNNPAHALCGLEEFSHMWIIFHFHETLSTKVQAKISPPRLHGQRTGVFATRSPHRPCPVGLSLVKIQRIEGNSVHFLGVDMVSGTPVLDLKPYIPLYDYPAPSPARSQDGELNMSERGAPDGQERVSPCQTGPAGSTRAEPTEPAGLTHTSPAGPAGSTHTSPDEPAGSTHTSPAEPAGSTHTSPAGPAGSTHTSPAGPAGSTHTSPAGPAGSTHTSPDEPAGSTHTSPAEPAGSTHTSPAGPAGSTHTSPAGPAGSTYTSPAEPAGSTHTSPAAPAGSTHSSAAGPAGSTHTSASGPAGSTHAGVRVPPWILSNPRHYTVTFSAEADERLRHLLGARAAVFKCNVSRLLAEDPRSGYVRRKYPDNLYRCALDELVVCAAYSDADMQCVVRAVSGAGAGERDEFESRGDGCGS